MGNGRAMKTVRALIQDGGVLDYDPQRSRLVVEIARALAEGLPVSPQRVEEIAAKVGVEGHEARQFMGEVAEQDADDNVVGIVPGLSLGDHPHRFSVNGVQMSAWCAADTLGLPAVLNQTAIVESVSPVSGEQIRLIVSPQSVDEASPAGAVVSIVIVEPENTHTSSAQEIWGTFCHHILFFSSRAEAEQWAEGRDEIEILSLEEAFEVVQLVVGKLLAHV